MKIQRRYWDKFHFEDAIRDLTVTSETESHKTIEPKNTWRNDLDKPAA